jgi:hypothetical protein
MKADVCHVGIKRVHVAEIIVAKLTLTSKIPLPYALTVKKQCLINHLRASNFRAAKLALDFLLLLRVNPPSILKKYPEQVWRPEDSSKLTGRFARNATYAFTSVNRNRYPLPRNTMPKDTGLLYFARRESAPVAPFAP